MKVVCKLSVKFWRFLTLLRVIVASVLNTIFIFLLSSIAFGATIVSPTEDQQIEAGSWITVVVKPAAGEQWLSFSVGFQPFEYDAFNKIYKLKIQIPNNPIGYRDDLEVYGVDSSYNEVTLKRRIFVKLPPNVVLKGITAGSKVVAGSTLVLLEKMPAGSKATDVENFEKEELKVYGNYSDGVKREITASASGTTYTSSDEKVVTVSSEGKVTAQGLGTATISVRNGKYSATVKVVVKPYK